MSVSPKQLIQFLSLLGAVATFTQPGQHANAQDGITDVFTTGSGCPAGTWQADVSEDRSEATLTFSEFFAVVDASQTFQTTNCQVRIDLSSLDALSYAVDSFDLEGYAHIEPDLSATIDVDAYFQGFPTHTLIDSSVDGPHEGKFFESWTPDPVDQVWSPCGIARTLLVHTRLGLKNAEGATQPSWIDLSTYEASSDARISVRLVRRRC
jgi:hypothetical protein